MVMIATVKTKIPNQLLTRSTSLMTSQAVSIFDCAKTATGANNKTELIGTSLTLSVIVTSRALEAHCTRCELFTANKVNHEFNSATCKERDRDADEAPDEEAPRFLDRLFVSSTRQE